MNQKTLTVKAAEPDDMYAGMLWFVTGNEKLQERNAANNGWIERPGVTLAATISGLWTFDRGANAPFAVDAASLVVTNLNADELDGFHATAFPRIRDSQKNLELVGIGETEICAYTIDGTNRLMKVSTFFRVKVGATNVTVKVYYTNVDNVAVTATLVDNKPLAVNEYTYPPILIEIKASTEVSLHVTASVANRVYVSGVIEEMA